MSPPLAKPHGLLGLTRRREMNVAAGIKSTQTPYTNWDARITGVEKPAAGTYGYYLFFEKD